MTDTSTLTYNDQVMKHFYSPHNMGDMEDPDAEAVVGNPVCGDVMKMMLKIAKRTVKGKEEEFIEDVKFKTLGCGAAIATSSVVTDLVKGKSLSDAIKVKNTDVVEALGGIPKAKIHCSILAEEAIHDALSNYQKKKK
ncbi:iron-sulfur cluster assembly scaffold protein [candidate division WWE3 bacterium CG_4_10_14_0_2_um_filter_42_7]|uniref:Iron-sulfur cluster assembly scaffold protein n=2 Tax=Katanobacteria TaxID=422282 RepID=A0A2H0X9J3_UNCKA|nr:MAG: iron-sulfur cluster assembly scaffold protein [candidate division WWE3 bacterium CG08_land_8_20_14_0_20_41_15]PIZ43738.1 MAG: iron-sulfur cluster assembly scaffold protein [candidate division WWE3 bacterium CG_4_10_14_0_2_um_filter_42_7]